MSKFRIQASIDVTVCAEDISGVLAAMSGLRSGKVTVEEVEEIKDEPPPARKRQQVSEFLRSAIPQHIREGHSVAATAEFYDVSESTVRRILAQAAAS